MYKESRRISLPVLLLPALAAHTRCTVLLQAFLMSMPCVTCPVATGAVHAVEQAAKTFNLVLLTSDDDSFDRKSTPGAAVLDAAAGDIEEGFELAATDNTSSSLVQVTVTKGAAIVGQSIKQIGFRGRFNAAVIAVKRSTQLQPGRLGDLVLQPRDVLVLSTGGQFNPTSEDVTKNFSG